MRNLMVNGLLDLNCDFVQGDVWQLSIQKWQWLWGWPSSLNRWGCLLEAYWADLLAQHESSSSSSSSPPPPPASSSSSSSSSWQRTIRVSSREDQTIGAWEWLLHHFLCLILLRFYFWNLFVWFDFVFGSCLMCPWCYPPTSLVFFADWVQGIDGKCNWKEANKDRNDTGQKEQKSKWMQMSYTSAAKLDMEHLTDFSLAGGRTPFWPLLSVKVLEESHYV